VDQFFAPSRFTARMHAERGFAPEMALLPHFIDADDSDSQQPEPRPQAAPYFLFVGRLELIKGLQNLIALWDAIPNYDLLVAGEGDYGARLREMAAGNPRIKFLGMLPQHQLGALYRHAVACIIPSITYETFGLICVEAFARRTPVLTSDIGALPELIEESGGGYVFRNGEELRDAIGRIGSSPPLRAELGQKGYDAFLKLWSREAHMDLYFDHLNRAAQKKFGCVPWQET
jgi:glycosyltransferase involved in cell wall biosynthesis